jgi:uracil-DNA glycosylase
MQVKIETSWKKALHAEFEKPYFSSLSSFVREEYKSGICYPAPKLIFAAFDHCSFDKVKVVILGQDPYHGPGQANGLCFSVNEGVKSPPSLVNIFKEIKSDLGIDIPQSGNLNRWADQGVLLLNATLSVREHQAGSHQGKGWEIFTDAVVELVNARLEHVVFMLWGNYAQKKGAIIDRKKHLVLSSAHPSPLSAHNGFWGNHHFSGANEYLVRYKKVPIIW